MRIDGLSPEQVKDLVAITRMSTASYDPDYTDREHSVWAKAVDAACSRMLLLLETTTERTALAFPKADPAIGGAPIE